MKVLYVGPYREGTGASNLSLNLINSLIKTDLPLAIRPIKFNQYQPKLSSEIIKLENTSSSNSDIIIQNVPPNMLVYNKKIKKNICYLNYHTNNFRHSDWPERLNMMDEIWVPSQFVKSSCLNSNVVKPIKVIPLGCEESTYLRNYGVDEQLKKEKNGDFIFYNISGAFSRRKNYAALIKAFHLEFDKNEPVNIALKYIKQYNPNEMSDRDFLQQIKKGLNLRNTKEEILLPSNYISDNDIYKIHTNCDVFVSTSYGEGWCIPAFEAMFFGRTPIVTRFGGYTDYINESTGWTVDCHLEPVFGMDSNSDNLFSGRELWASISIPSLQKNMREAYENKILREEKSENGINKIFDYSHEKVSSLIKKAIYE